MADNNEQAHASTDSSPFAGLGEAEKRILSYAAAMGKEFDFSVLAAVVEMGEEPLAELLEQLVHHGILSELKGGDVYAFARMDTLAQAYRDISSSRLRVIHKKIAEAYEKLNPDPAPDIIPEMGRHFYLGRVHDKSLLYNRYAARLAMSAFSPDVAIRYLERVKEDLAAIPGDHSVEEAVTLKEMGEQYESMGDNARADELYGESLGKLPEGEITLRGLLLISRAEAARETDKLDLARQTCEEAIRLLEKVGHRKGLAMAHRSLGRASFRQGNLEDGRKEIEKTIELLDPVESAKEVAGCYIDLGNVYAEVDDPIEHLKTFEFYTKAIEILEPLHDYNELARAHNNLALAMMPDHAQEAIEHIMTARGISEKSKDRRGAGWWRFNSVEIRLALGQVEEAIQDNEEAGKILTLVTDPFGVQQVSLNRGIIAQHRKLNEEAEKAYLDSIRRAEALNYPSVIVETLVHLASLYLEWGRKEDAAKAMAHIKELGEERVYHALKDMYNALKVKISGTPG
jgi:tetratricopeptide (TPR) repeat protein